MASDLDLDFIPDQAETDDSQSLDFQPDPGPPAASATRVQPAEEPVVASAPPKSDYEKKLEVAEFVRTSPQYKKLRESADPVARYLGKVPDPNQSDLSKWAEAFGVIFKNLPRLAGKGLGFFEKGTGAIVGKVAGTGDTIEDVGRAIMPADIGMGQPLPVEEAAANIPGKRGTLARIGLGLAESAPKIAMIPSGEGIPALLTSSAVAGGLFGLDAQGNFHPKEAAIGALLPGAGKLAHSLVAKGLAAGLKSGVPLLDNAFAQKAIESLGSQAALNVVQLAGDSPELIDLYKADPEKAKQRVEEIIGQNLAFELLGIRKWRGAVPSETESFIVKSAEKYGDLADRFIARGVVGKEGAQAIAEAIEQARQPRSPTVRSSRIAPGGEEDRFGLRKFSDEQMGMGPQPFVPPESGPLRTIPDVRKQGRLRVNLPAVQSSPAKAVAELPPIGSTIAVEMGEPAKEVTGTVVGYKAEAGGPQVPVIQSPGGTMILPATKRYETGRVLDAKKGEDQNAPQDRKEQPPVQLPGVTPGTSVPANQEEIRQAASEQTGGGDSAQAGGNVPQEKAPDSVATEAPPDALPEAGYPYGNFVRSMVSKGYRFADSDSEEALVSGGRKYPTLVSPDGAVKLAIDTTGRFVRKDRRQVWVGDPTQPMEDALHLEAIVTAADKRGGGLASQVMRDAVAASDEAKIRLEGEPTPIKSATKRGQKSFTQQQLWKWYKKLGFVEQEGSQGLLMERKPRDQEKIVAAKKAAATREGNRTPDLIDWIEGNYPNGIRVSSAKEFGSYVDRARGAARKILFKEKAELETADTVLRAASDEGYVFGSEDEFLQAVLDAGASREENAARQKRETEAGERAGRFQAATQKGKLIVSPEKLKVGDAVTVDRERLTVKRIDAASGEVTLRGGEKFVEQTVRFGQKFYAQRFEAAKGRDSKIAGDLFEGTQREPAVVEKPEAAPVSGVKESSPADPGGAPEQGLSTAENKELSVFVLRDRAVREEKEGAKPLTSAERQRYDELMAKAGQEELPMAVPEKAQAVVPAETETKAPTTTKTPKEQEADAIQSIRDFSGSLTPEQERAVAAAQKYRVKNAGPQTFSIVERLAQSEAEKEAGEQPVKIKNDKTGKEEVVLEADLQPVKTRTAAEREASKGMSRKELDEALLKAGMEPSEFPDAASKRAALKRFRAKGGLKTGIEGAGDEAKTIPDSEVARRQSMERDLLSSGELLRAGKDEIETLYPVSSRTDKPPADPAKTRRIYGEGIRRGLRSGPETRTEVAARRPRFVIETHAEKPGGVLDESNAVFLAHRILREPGQSQSGKFNSKLVQNLKGLSFLFERLGLRDEDAHGQFDPNRGVIVLNLDKVGRYDFSNPDTLAAWDAVVGEELIHAATWRVSSPKELAEVWQSLSKLEREKVRGVYKKDFPSDVHAGAEYVRMILQERLAGGATERLDTGLSAKVKSALNKLLRYLRTVFGQKPENDIARQVINRIEAAIAGRQEMDDTNVFGGRLESGEGSLRGQSAASRRAKAVADYGKAYEAERAKNTAEVEHAPASEYGDELWNVYSKSKGNDNQAIVYPRKDGTGFDVRNENDMYLDRQEKLEDALDSAKTHVESGGTRDLSSIEAAARQEIINAIDVPAGMELKDVQDTKWGSVYYLVRKVLSLDEDGEPDDYQDYKISIRNHDPSPFREKEFGASDAWFEVSKSPSPQELADAVAKVEKYLVRKAQLSKLESSAGTFGEEFGREGPAAEEAPRRNRHQVAGVKQLGSEYEMENIERIRGAVRAQFFDGSQPISDGMSEAAWNMLQDLTDPGTRQGNAEQVRNLAGGEMAPGLLRNELWNYALRLSFQQRDPSLLRFMVERNQDIATLGGGGSDTQAGRALRAAQDRATGPLWANLVELTRQRSRSGARALGVGEDLFNELLGTIDSLDISAEDLERMVVTGTDTRGRPVREVFEEMSPEAREAERILDQYERSQTEWLKPEKQLSIIRQIIRESIQGGPAAQYRQQAEFVDFVSRRFQEATVPKEIADRLAFEVWKDKQAREASATAKAIRGEETREQRNAEALLDQWAKEQTEWVKPERRNQTKDIIKEFMARNVDKNNPDAFRSPLAERLRGIGVPDAVAREVAVQAWNRKLTFDDAKLARALEIERDRAAKQAERIAQSMVNRLEASQTEWVKPDGAPTVAKIIAEALRPLSAGEKREFKELSVGRDTPEKQARYDALRGRDVLPEADPASFMAPLRGKLVAAGVTEATAYRLAREIYNKRVTDWTTARARAMERAAESGSLRSLIEAIKGSPYRAQKDAAWRLKTATEWFMSNGLAREQAEAAAKLFDAQFSKALATAAERNAQRILKDKEPKTLRDVIQAIRAGLTDPDKSWPDEIAKREGYKPLTKEQHARIAELEAKLSAPEISTAEQVQITEQIMGVFRHAGWKEGATARFIAGSYANSLLSGIRTAALHVFQPMSSLLLRDVPLFVTQNLHRPRDILTAGRTVIEAAKTWFPEAKFAWQNDAYTFSSHEMSLMHNELKRQYEIAKGELSSKSPKGILKGALRMLYAWQHFVTRVLQTANQAGMAITRDVKLALYGSTAMKEAGLSTKEISELVDVAIEAKNAAYEDALLRGMDKTTAAVVADERANDALAKFFSNAVGDQKGREIMQAAENDAYSIVGRRAPGISEEDEGWASKPITGLMQAITKMRARSGQESMLTIAMFGFVNVPLRLARYHLNSGPYALLRYGIDRYRAAHGKETFWKQSFANSLQVKQRLLEGLFGTGLMVGGGLLAAQFHSSDEDLQKRHWGVYFTGAGPKSRVLRDAWQKRGFRPYSIQFVVGGTMVNFPLTRVGQVFAQPFALAATMDDAEWARKEAAAAGKEVPQKISQTLGLGVGNYYHMVLGDMGLFQAGEHMVRLGRGEKNIGSAVADQLSGVAAATVIPGKQLLSNISEMIFGPLDRSSVQSSIAANFPVLGAHWQQKAINRFGDQLYDQSLYGKASKLGIPFAVRVSDTPENRQLYGLMVNKGAAAPDLRRYVIEEKYGPLSDEQWSKFAKISGDSLKKSVLSSLEGLKDAPAEEVKKFLVKMGSVANQEAAAELALNPVKVSQREFSGGAAGADVKINTSGRGIPGPVGESGGIGRVTPAKIPGSAGAGAGYGRRLGTRTGVSSGLRGPGASGGGLRGRRLVSGKLRARSASGGRLRRIGVAKTHRRRLSLA